MKVFALLNENFKVSVGSIRSNLLRSILTALIIAFGIMALVGILTAVSSIKSTINKQFALMGTNTFTIESWGFEIQIGDKHERKKNYSYISYRQASEFKRLFDFPATVSISVNASGTATIKYKSKKTHPNISVIGTDENYIYTAGLEIEKGRNFIPSENEMAKNSIILGSDVVTKLFKSDEDPINKSVSLGSGRYNVIGVLKKKGTSINSGDNMCLIPYSNVRQYFSWPRQNFSISVTPDTRELFDPGMGYAEMLFRKVRNLNVRDESDFNINTSDFFSNILKDVIKNVVFVTTILGIITLFGAAIGLMNIMLVSVKERTREIGIRKAIGAKNNIIKQQFLFEAVLICQLGGIVGIVLGIIVGNIVSLIFKSAFIIPWVWIIGGLGLCFVVGLTAGLYPAVRASKLEPIVALHYE